MAVPHSHHCAPDQLHGGEAGKGVQAFTTAATVYILPWECCNEELLCIAIYVSAQEHRMLLRIVHKVRNCFKCWSIFFRFSIIIILQFKYNSMQSK